MLRSRGNSAFGWILLSLKGSDNLAQGEALGRRTVRSVEPWRGDIERLWPIDLAPSGLRSHVPHVTQMLWGGLGGAAKRGPFKVSS